MSILQKASLNPALTTCILPQKSVPVKGFSSVRKCMRASFLAIQLTCPTCRAMVFAPVALAQTHGFSARELSQVRVVIQTRDSWEEPARERGVHDGCRPQGGGRIPAQ